MYSMDNIGSGKENIMHDLCWVQSRRVSCTASIDLVWDG
jgi:hypothetical protein